MVPLFETKAPFVIKVYDTYFNITWDGLEEKPEDNYYYQKVRTIIFQKGEETVKRELAAWLIRSIFKVRGSGHYSDPDQLLIKLKNGKSETRYFDKFATPEHMEAIEMIKSKL